MSIDNQPLVCYTLTMRTGILIGLLLILGGCVTPQQRLAQNYSECAAMVDPSWSRQGQESFMRQCVQIQPGHATVTPVYPGGSAYGQADAFGPMGYRGPTWEQFNGAVQNQTYR